MRRILLVALLALGTPPCMAQEDLTSRLAALNQQIETAQGDVAAVSTKLQGLERELKEINAKIATLESDQADTNTRVDEAEREQARLEVETAEARKRISELQALSLKRLRALYLYEGRGANLTLLTSGSGGSLTRGAFYLKKVRNFDATLLIEIERARTEAEEHSKSLAKLAEMERALRDSLAEQKRNYKLKSDERQKLRGLLLREQERREGLLTEIRAQALRLETVLASLTNSGVLPDQRPLRSRARKESRGGGFSSFSGEGLDSRRGKLHLPVPGAVVVQRYTGQASAKGVTMLGEKGAEVEAVGAGKVVFVGKMPELGTVVVIDHGQRSYSLYGLLVDITVVVGEEVEESAVIGKTSDPSRAGGNLYFEIRRAGAAVDPLPYFSKK